MLVYCAYPMAKTEPQWVAPLAAALHGVPKVSLYRPWIPLHEQLQNPDLRDDLMRPPRPAFVENFKAFRLRDELFGDLDEIGGFLASADGDEPLIKAADKDLYCLMRSDMMLVDLSAPGYGEQGLDALFGHLGGMPVIGLTDRFQNAPSLVSRLDCLIAPTNVGQITHVIGAFGRKAKGPASSMEQHAQPPPQPAATPENGPEIDQGFASDVLRAAGVVTAETTNDGKSSDPVP